MESINIDLYINSLGVSKNLIHLTIFNLPCDILKIICSYVIEPKYKFIDIITNNILKYTNLKKKRIYS
jgi:hypothetical protein